MVPLRTVASTTTVLAPQVEVLRVTRPTTQGIDGEQEADQDANANLMVTLAFEPSQLSDVMEDEQSSLPRGRQRGCGRVRIQDTLYWGPELDFAPTGAFRIRTFLSHHQVKDRFVPDDL